MSPARNIWLDGKQRPTELRSGLILMGARAYMPQLGRFLQVDPILGGSANRYDCVNQDPASNYDLAGTICIWKCIKKAAKKVFRGIKTVASVPLYPVRNSNARRGLVEIVGGGLGVGAGAVTFAACAALGGEVDLAAHCFLPTYTVGSAG